MSVNMFEEAALAERHWERVETARDAYSDMARDSILEGDGEHAAQWAATAATYGRELLYLLRLWTRGEKP